MRIHNTVTNSFSPDVEKVGESVVNIWRKIRFRKSSEINNKLLYLELFIQHETEKTRTRILTQESPKFLDQNWREVLYRVLLTPKAQSRNSFFRYARRQNKIRTTTHHNIY